MRRYSMTQTKEMEMKTYEITNATSGLFLGVYEGGSEEAALDALARDAGYADHAEACAVTDDDGSDLMVKLCSPSS